MPSAVAGTHARSSAAERKRASGCSRAFVGVGRRRSSRSCRSAALLCSRSRPRTVGVAVARYYDPATAQFLTRDPLEDQTRDAYGYAANDPINASDPSGLDWCWGDYCLGFHPMDGVNALVNIGRGASFGQSDKIANFFSPGASCTVAHNLLDETIGFAGSMIAMGAGGAYVRLAEAARGVESAEQVSASSGQLSWASKLFEQGGRTALEKSRGSIAQRLAEHEAKLVTYREAGGYTSSVEREIRNFQGQLNAIDQILGG